MAIDNPSFITFSHDKNFLYAICDQGVSAYAVLEDGSLELMNVASINGMRGCHICVTSDNRFLVVSDIMTARLLFCTSMLMVQWDL